jgi:hypothetical protein
VSSPTAAAASNHKEIATKQASTTGTSGKSPAQKVSVQLLILAAAERSNAYYFGIN